jgi:hypothetical protein
MKSKDDINLKNQRKNISLCTVYEFVPKRALRIYITVIGKYVHIKALLSATKCSSFKADYYFSCPTGMRFESNYNWSSLFIQCKLGNTFAVPDVWPTCANGRSVLSAHCQQGVTVYLG